jgi:GTP-binding protein HflX
VESFKSTLDEVREADLLLHVIDISHPGFEEQVAVVNATLKDLDSINKPAILVFNKTDLFSFNPKDEDDLTPVQRENLSLEDLRKTWMARAGDQRTVFISAKRRDNFEELRRMLYEEVRKIHVARYPYNEFLYEAEGPVI